MLSWQGGNSGQQAAIAAPDSDAGPWAQAGVFKHAVLCHAGRTMEDQIRDLVHFFFHKGLLLKADRKFKKPKPGRKRLVKFPRTLLPCQVRGCNVHAAGWMQHASASSQGRGAGVRSLQV